MAAILKRKRQRCPVKTLWGGGWEGRGGGERGRGEGEGRGGGERGRGEGEGRRGGERLGFVVEGLGVQVLGLLSYLLVLMD